MLPDHFPSGCFVVSHRSFVSASVTRLQSGDGLDVEILVDVPGKVPEPLHVE
jgi:hypothetical protein